MHQMALACIVSHLCCHGPWQHLRPFAAIALSAVRRFGALHLKQRAQNQEAHSRAQMNQMRDAYIPDCHRMFAATHLICGLESV